jgi:hypothetical protein
MMGHPHRTSGVGGRWTRLDLPVWVALAVMLGIGSALIGAVEARTISLADPQGSLRVQYPAGWIATPGAPGLLDVQDPLSGAAVPTRLIVTRETRAAGQTLSQIAGETVLNRTQQFAMYRVLRQRDVRVGGKNALAIDYAFVADPHEAVLSAQRLPVVMRGTEVVVLADGVVYFIDIRATAALFDRERSTIRRILRGIQL